MLVDSAISRLLRALEVACLDRRNDDISKSLKSTCVAINSNYFPGKTSVTPETSGGDVLIRFGGVKQPEVARLVDSILTPILIRLELSNDSIHRHRLSNTFERYIEFFVTDKQVDDFVRSLDNISEQIEKDPDLLRQFQCGVALANQSDYFPTAKAYLLISCSDDKNSRVNLKLVLSNIPKDLKHELCRCSRLNLDSETTVTIELADPDASMKARRQLANFVKYKCIKQDRSL